MSSDPIDEELLRQQEEEQRQEYTEGGDGNGNNGNGNISSNGDGGNGNGRPSKDDRLAELAKEKISLLFKDPYDKAHAVIYIRDHYETIRVESGKFKRYLSRLFYENENQVIKAESITNVVQVLQAKAEFEGQTIPLALRVTWDNNGDICYDLTNEKWQYVRISKEGWRIINNETPNPIFIRYNQIPQIIPDRGYEPDIFDRFLQLANLKEDKDRILLKVYIISLIIPEIPHVIMVLHGRQGSAKSTLQTMIKLLVDPAKPKLLTIYNDTKEFIQQLAHNHVAYYDNLKRAPGWLSDEVCKAVTGIGSTKRKLYSDDDDIIYEYKRCIGFSGINSSLSEPDALDRSITIELLRINPENRKDEKVIMTEFFELRPKLLGYMFDVLAKALQIRDTIKLSDLPRMADFAIWGEAIARAMGYEELAFISAYYDNIGKQNIEAIEYHPLGQVIARFISERQGFVEGPPSEVLRELEVFAAENHISTDHKLWPKGDKWFTRRLNQISSNLLEGLGIDVQITRVTSVRGKYNTAAISIRKMTPVSPVSPVLLNYAQILRKRLETYLPLERNDSSEENDSSENIENHAQNPATGETGETGDIFNIEGDSSPIYSHLIKPECLPQIGRYFSCKEHPDIWDTSLKGLEESHFKPFHNGEQSGVKS